MIDDDSLGNSPLLTPREKMSAETPPPSPGTMDDRRRHAQDVLKQADSLQQPKSRSITPALLQRINEEYDETYGRCVNNSLLSFFSLSIFFQMINIVLLHDKRHEAERAKEVQDMKDHHTREANRGIANANINKAEIISEVRDASTEMQAKYVIETGNINRKQDASLEIQRQTLEEIQKLSASQKKLERMVTEDRRERGRPPPRNLFSEKPKVDESKSQRSKRVRDNNSDAIDKHCKRMRSAKKP